VTALAIVLSTLGGLSELVGVALVVFEIRDDRRRAEHLFQPRTVHPQPKRQYPGRVLPPGPSPFSGMMPADRQQRDLENALGKIGTTLANGLIDMRKAVDSQLDVGLSRLREESLHADNELRSHLRYILAGGIKNRKRGVLLLILGIVLGTGGSILGSLPQ
jgi:hypothetical protein